MRTSERLTVLKDWLYENLCKGREMKTPPPDGDITKIVRQEPNVYIGFVPMRPDETSFNDVDALNVAPGIVVMPVQGVVKFTEEKRFDRFSNVHRPQEMGHELSVQILMSVFEDGVRLPGFIESANPDALNDTPQFDMSLIREGTQEGLYTLLNWMDDLNEKLLGTKIIPGTDMYVDETALTYGLRSDQRFITDTRPIYYGIVNVTFWCYADEKPNYQLKDLLD